MVSTSHEELNNIRDANLLNNECIICVLINVAVFEVVSIAYITLNLR